METSDRAMKKEMEDNQTFGSQGYFMSDSVPNRIQDYKRQCAYACVCMDLCLYMCEYTVDACM